MVVRAASLCMVASLLGVPATAGDSGALWLKPRTSPAGAEIVVRRATVGPMPFTITSHQAQVLDEAFQVIGPFGVPVYTVPAPPYTFGAGETSVTATSMILVPGEYRIRFGGQGLSLRVDVPDSPLVTSGFVFAPDPVVVDEPVQGAYSFRVPDDALGFGLTLDLPGGGADDHATVEVRNDLGEWVATHTCGAAGSPVPGGCGRLAVVVPAERSGSFWRLDVTHQGDLALAMDSLPFALAAETTLWFEPHRFVLDPTRPGGRDCEASLGGAWHPATAACEVVDWQFHPRDTLEIRAGVTLTLDGVVRSSGSIDNGGTLINRGLLESFGTFDNAGEFVNRGSFVHTGQLTNAGAIANHGELSNDGHVVNHGLFTNHCSGSIDGAGTIAGNAVQPDAEDADGDGVCTADDCAANDPTAWSPAGPVRSLALDRADGGTTTALAWHPPVDGGASEIAYDVLRSGFPDMGAAACLVSAGAEVTALEFATPVGGQTFFYLARATNGCGPGAAGTDSAGSARLVPACAPDR